MKIIDVAMALGAALGAAVGVKVAYRLTRAVQWKINAHIEREAQEAMRDARVCGCGRVIPGRDARFYDGEGVRCAVCGPLLERAEPKAPAPA